MVSVEANLARKNDALTTLAKNSELFVAANELRWINLSVLIEWLDCLSHFPTEQLREGSPLHQLRMMATDRIISALCFMSSNNCKTIDDVTEELTFYVQEQNEQHAIVRAKETTAPGLEEHDQMQRVSIARWDKSVPLTDRIRRKAHFRDLSNDIANQPTPAKLPQTT